MKVSQELQNLLDLYKADKNGFLAEPALVSPQVKAMFIDGKATGNVDLSNARTTVKPIIKPGANQGKRWTRVYITFKTGDVSTDNLPLSLAEVNRILIAGTDKVEIGYSLSTPDENGRQYDQFSLLSIVGTPANTPALNHPAAANA